MRSRWWVDVELHLQRGMLKYASYVSKSLKLNVWNVRQVVRSLQQQHRMIEITKTRHNRFHDHHVEDDHNPKVQAARLTLTVVISFCGS